MSRSTGLFPSRPARTSSRSHPPIVRLLLLLLLVMPAPLARSATATPEVSADGLWRHVDEALLLEQGTEPTTTAPRPGRTVRLDVQAFLDLVDRAPLEFTVGADEAAPVMTLPMPDGSFGRFAVQESPIMEPALAAKLWQVRTYRAQGIDDPAATARLDFTPTGFHGLVLSSTGTVYIDPYRRGDIENYVSYWRRDYRRAEGETPFVCDFAPPPRDGVDANRKTGRDDSVTISAVTYTSGPTLRTYRLAVACTGEYATYHGGTVEGAQAAIVTTFNRVNGIYEKELAVRMTLIYNTSIIYTNASTDPYTNTPEDVDTNQSIVDNAIGSSNYDIGHLVSTGGGGVAYSGVCNATYKARGLTGSSSPEGDPYDVDYVAHEVGHQFGAPHTFNSESGGCSGNRTDLAAYEPGSGSTIMAYAGICSPENLQSNSDAYFHGKSFVDIQAYIASSATCSTTSSTGNSAPTVDAGASYTIPSSTPFALTGHATDPNSDDHLTYNWEEFDLNSGTSGTTSPPLVDDGSSPIFRSFTAVSSPTRMFPKLSDILSNTTTFGETMPTTTRTMTFRLTARDNRSGGGGVAYASTTVNVTSTAGPFQVTAPNTAVTWAGGSSQTVTWNVANTTASPVSCANVMISLSTDGGTAFKTTLSESTTNDGSESITVPNSATTTARVKVECGTSPFFDISNTNFTITASVLPPTGLTAIATSSTSVSLEWSVASGAASYDVYRSTSGTSYFKIGSTAESGYVDETVTDGIAYLYAVKTVDGGGSSSAYSSPDVATTVVFTDPTITAQSTTIKAAHVTQLRTAVNAVRTLAGMGAYSFTDATITAGTTKAKAVHVSELRSALDSARSTLGLSAVSYTDGTLTAGSTTIKKAHIEDLRGGVR